MVPTAPGFPLQPCRVSTTSKAHLCGMRSTLSSRPHQGFPPFRHCQGWCCYQHARFRVAQSSLTVDSIGSKGAFQLPAPNVAHRAPLRAAGFSDPQRLATVQVRRRFCVHWGGTHAHKIRECAGLATPGKDRQKQNNVAVFATQGISNYLVSLDDIQRDLKPA